MSFNLMAFFPNTLYALFFPPYLRPTLFFILSFFVISKASFLFIYAFGIIKEMESFNFMAFFPNTSYVLFFPPYLRPALFFILSFFVISKASFLFVYVFWPFLCGLLFQAYFYQNNRGLYL